MSETNINFDVGDKIISIITAQIYYCVMIDYESNTMIRTNNTTEIIDDIDNNLVKYNGDKKVGESDIEYVRGISSEIDIKPSYLISSDLKSISSAGIIAPSNVTYSLDDEINIINDIIKQAVSHGGDTGDTDGSYESNEEGLRDSINRWLRLRNLDTVYEVLYDDILQIYKREK